MLTDRGAVGAHVVLVRVRLRGLRTSLRINMASASPAATSAKSTSVSTSSQPMPPPLMPLVSMPERRTTQAASKRDLGNVSSLGKPPKQARTDTGTFPQRAGCNPRRTCQLNCCRRDGGHRISATLRRLQPARLLANSYASPWRSTGCLKSERNSICFGSHS